MSKTRSSAGKFLLLTLLSLGSCIFLANPMVKAETEVVPKYPGSTEGSTSESSSEQDIQASTSLPTAPDGSTETSNQILSPKTGIVSGGVIIFVVAAAASGIIYDRRRLSRKEAQRSEK